MQLPSWCADHNVRMALEQTELLGDGQAANEIGDATMNEGEKDYRMEDLAQRRVSTRLV